MTKLILIDTLDDVPFGSIRARDLILSKLRGMDARGRLDRLDVVAPMRAHVREVQPLPELIVLPPPGTTKAKKVSQKSLVNPKPRKRR